MNATRAGGKRECVVCGRPLADEARVPLCDEHFPEQSRDALRDVAAQLEWQHRQGDWLIFWARVGYGPSGISGRGWRAELIAQYQVEYEEHLERQNPYPSVQRWQGVHPAT